MLLNVVLSPDCADELGNAIGGGYMFRREMMNRAMHAAARGGDLEILRDAAAYQDAQGATILHAAAARGQVEISVLQGRNGKKDGRYGCYVASTTSKFKLFPFCMRRISKVLAVGESVKRSVADVKIKRSCTGSGGTWIHTHGRSREHCTINPLCAWKTDITSPNRVDGNYVWEIKS